MSSFLLPAFIAYILNFLQCQQGENNHLRSWSLNPSSCQTPFIYPGQTHKVSAFQFLNWRVVNIQLRAKLVASTV